MTNILRRIFQPFHPVALEVQRRVGYSRTPEVQVRNGRPMVTFRGLGADEWEPAKRASEAARIADAAREAMQASDKKVLARRSAGAVVVVLLDEHVLPGGVATSEFRFVVRGMTGERSPGWPVLG